MSNVINIQHLGMSFPREGEVLRDISLSIPRGEVVGIVGASGSGKSLTAWSLLGVVPEKTIVRGQVRFYHVDGRITHVIDDHAVKRTISGRLITVIPQNPLTSLNPVIKCGPQILEALQLMHGAKPGARELVISMLDTLKLDDAERIYESYPFELSGGQLQRVVVAMAMIADPDVIVADEPTTALDALNRQWILQTLVSWASSAGRSLVLISHDATAISRYCGLIYVVGDGRILDEIRDKTQHERMTRLRAHGLCADFAENNRETRLGENSEVFQMSGISKSFTNRSGVSVAALDNVSLGIRPGETVSLVGPSGCGKSTIARIASGLIAPDHGEVKYQGTTRDPKDLHREVQMIFQDPYSALYPHKSIGYSLGEALAVHHGVAGAERKAIAQALLTRVSLPVSFMDKMAGELSGGERQRVQIARALAVQPTVLICDESVSGLDAPVQASILNLLAQIQKDTGMAILMISHDLALVRNISDRIMVISNGQIVEQGIPAEIFQKPVHPLTKSLIAAIQA